METPSSLFADRVFDSHDGLKLFARDYAGGGGPARCPVICIHGLTRNSSDFDEIAPWIAGLGRRVLAVDVRGRGRSAYDPEPKHYHPLVYAKDVVKLFADLGIARAVFIGTSMGGLITMTLALRHLRLISAAILNDVGPVISPKGIARVAQYVGKTPSVSSWSEAADYMKRTNQVAFPNNSEFEWAKWARRTFAENESGQLRLQYDPDIAHALRTGKPKVRSLIANLAFRRLSRNRPTLLIRGALSDIIEPQQAEAMRKMAPAMRYVEVPGVGHAPMLMEAEARAAIQDFLATVP